MRRRSSAQLSSAHRDNNKMTGSMAATQRTWETERSVKELWQEQPCDRRLFCRPTEDSRRAEVQESSETETNL